jgi:hypothetical protein
MRAVQGKKKQGALNHRSINAAALSSMIEASNKMRSSMPKSV